MRRSVYNHDAIVKLADCLSISRSIIEDEMMEFGQLRNRIADSDVGELAEISSIPQEVRTAIIFSYVIEIER
jgi:hypothetical protein